jgi:hypothetical protein
MVYKVASCQGKHSVPVGVVSKNYRLVDHPLCAEDHSRCSG